MVKHTFLTLAMPLVYIKGMWVSFSHHCLLSLLQVFSCCVWWWCTSCGCRCWMWWMSTLNTSAPHCVRTSSCPSPMVCPSCLPLSASSSACWPAFSSYSLAEPSRSTTTDFSQQQVRGLRCLEHTCFSFSPSFLSFLTTRPLIISPFCLPCKSRTL